MIVVLIDEQTAVEREVVRCHQCATICNSTLTAHEKQAGVAIRVVNKHAWAIAELVK